VRFEVPHRQRGVLDRQRVGLHECAEHFHPPAPG
jgi:hypothetical protein